jgi:hypothetical protein
MSSLRLRVGGEQPVDVVVHAPGPHWCGRDAAADVTVLDRRVSRQHARLELRDDRWWFVDQSSQGSFDLAGQQIDELAVGARTSVRLADPITGPVLDMEPEVLRIEQTPRADEDGDGDGEPTGNALESFEDRVEIGRGGFAVVYRAYQARFGRTVAIKVIDPGTDAAGRERFERECAAMGTLASHPNITTVFDGGLTPEGHAYLVMEYMPDGNLEERVGRAGQLPWPEVLSTGVKLAAALETAHQAGILHRDVKPANVLVSPYGEPCLSDFGLARFEGRTGSSAVTATVLHAPPEILGAGQASVASDVYSLGSSLYTLLAGRGAFDDPADETVFALMHRIATDPPADLRAHGVPDAVANVIEWSLRKDPAERPASARELGLALQRAEAGLGLPVTDLRVLGAPPPSREAPAPRGLGTVPLADLEAQGGTPPTVPTPPGATPLDPPGRRRWWRRR